MKIEIDDDAFDKVIQKYLNKRRQDLELEIPMSSTDTKGYVRMFSHNPREDMMAIAKLATAYRTILQMDYGMEFESE